MPLLRSLSYLKYFDDYDGTSLCTLLLQKPLDNYIVVKDYTNETDGFTVNVGDIVEAFEYADHAK